MTAFERACALLTSRIDILRLLILAISVYQLQSRHGRRIGFRVRLSRRDQWCLIYVCVSRAASHLSVRARAQLLQIRVQFPHSSLFLNFLQHERALLVAIHKVPPLGPLRFFRLHDRDVFFESDDVPHRLFRDAGCVSITSTIVFDVCE